MSTPDSHHSPVVDRPAGKGRPGHGHADWEERYAGAPVWSGNPNVALVAEVSDLAPGRALDVGCGEGADAIWLASRRWRVTAIDVATNALGRGRAAAEAALLGAVAPGGTLLVVHHAEIDRAVAQSHGFDPDDYVGHDDVVAALGDGWVIEVKEQRERDVTGGAGAHHHHDLVVRARRLPV